MAFLKSLNFYTANMTYLAELSMSRIDWIPPKSSIFYEKWAWCLHDDATPIQHTVKLRVLTRVCN